MSIIPRNERPGYQALNFAGGNTQSPAEAAEQWASMGPGYMQTYETMDDDTRSIRSQTVFHDEAGEGDAYLREVGTALRPNADVTPPAKVDQGAQGFGDFSRGIHPNVDPANPGPGEPPPASYVESQPGTGGGGPSYKEPPPDRSLVRHEGVGTVEVSTQRPGRKFTTRADAGGGGYSRMAVNSGIFPAEGAGADMQRTMENSAMNNPQWAARQPPLNREEFGS